MADQEGMDFTFDPNQIIAEAEKDMDSPTGESKPTQEAAGDTSEAKEDTQDAATEASEPKEPVKEPITEPQPFKGDFWDTSKLTPEAAAQIKAIQAFYTKEAEAKKNSETALQQVTAREQDKDRQIAEAILDPEKYWAIRKQAGLPDPRPQMPEKKDLPQLQLNTNMTPEQAQKALGDYINTIVDMKDKERASALASTVAQIEAKHRNELSDVARPVYEEQAQQAAAKVFDKYSETDKSVQEDVARTLLETPALANAVRAKQMSLENALDIVYSQKYRDRVVKAEIARIAKAEKDAKAAATTKPTSKQGHVPVRKKKAAETDFVQDVMREAAEENPEIFK